MKLADIKTHPCEKCKAEVTGEEWASAMLVCPRCGGYNRIPARRRIAYLVDEGAEFRELGATLASGDPIGFPSYTEKLEAARAKSGERDGVITGVTLIGGYTTCLFVMESNFMMGSMGTVVGDKIAALFEYAVKYRLPVIGYTVSGGARMQEGMLSLMQMAKVSGAVKRHSDAGLLYAVCATDPTTGGVTASFAMLGDVIFSEPGAVIGFAGRRVVEQVTGSALPKEFQTAEFQMKNGFLDAIVPRYAQRAYLARLLALHTM